MLNKVTLIGNVGGTPNIKEFENGKVAQFSLATSERGYKTKDGREIPDKTEWHHIVVWNGLAKVVENYVEVGSKVYIEGKLRTRAYEQDGIKKYITEVICTNLILLGSREQRPGSRAPRQEPSKPLDPAENYNAGDNYSVGDTDEDLPF